MIKKIISASLLFFWAGTLFAQNTFEVTDIRVKGLERITAGTIFNYLEVKVGDTFNPSQSSNIIRELYKTGYFENIKITSEGSVLILEVEEYPSIAEIVFEGNKLIKDEPLIEALSSNGFVEGRVYKPNVLTQIKKELKRQYLNQGKYNAQVETEVTELPRNRVAVTVHVKEGATAKIRKINIVGNQYFSEKILLKQFESKHNIPFYKFWDSGNQYSREKVSGDLEAIRSFYQNQGFLDFKILSNQVSIAPQKDGVFLTINIQEGERYIVSNFVLNGRLVIPEEELLPYVFIAPGKTYSRSAVDVTIEAIKGRLAEEGYSYADVVPLPKVNSDENTVSFSINIKPGKRVYVRRIDVVGNTITNDNVIRRELRQVEGAAFSPSRVNRSKIRLQRLSFFEEVEIETINVAGRDDQVDLQVIVKERSTGNLLFGFGYSQDNGALIQANAKEANLLGTGNLLNLSLQRSDVITSANLQYTNPYYTQSGISRTISLGFSNIDADRARTSSYITETVSLNLNYLFPINEHNAFIIGGGLERIDLRSTQFTVPEVLEFIDENSESDIATLITAFTHDTRDSLIYPTSGKYLRASFDATVPGSDLEFYRVNLEASMFVPITQRIAWKLGGSYGYGDGYGDTDDLPFFRNYFTGGTTSVRGYRARSLGPRDTSTFASPFGGNQRILLSTALFLPLGGSLDRRLSLFIDAGQVFAPDESLETSEIRYSAGIGFNWLSPVGPLSISYAFPFNDQVGDDTESFQFTIGRVFQ